MFFSFLFVNSKATIPWPNFFELSWFWKVHKFLSLTPFRCHDIRMALTLEMKETIGKTQRNLYLNSLQVAIVITDGEQTTTQAYTPLDIASKRIKDKGVEVFALGVGSGVNVDQLRQIASSNDNVFTSPGFEELVNVVKPIVEKSCPSKRPSSSWKQTWLLNFSKTFFFNYENHSIYFLAFSFSCRKLTLKLLAIILLLFLLKWDCQL